MTKFKKKKVKQLNIKYGDKKIKHHCQVKYLGCTLNETVSGKVMTLIF